jgi:hypothetical protein
MAKEMSPADRRALQEEVENLTRQTRAVSEDLEETATYARKVADDVFESRVDSFHGEAGHSSIQSFAEAHGISYREALQVVGGEFYPERPSVSPTRSTVTDEMIWNRAQTQGISYRDALAAFTEDGHTLDVGGSE